MNHVTCGDTYFFCKSMNIYITHDFIVILIAVDNQLLPGIHEYTIIKIFETVLGHFSN